MYPPYRSSIKFDYVDNNVASLEDYTRKFVGSLVPTVYSSISIGE